MAGQYSGQGASAFATGFQNGYGFVDKAVAAKDEAEKRKLLIEKQSMENEMYQVAMDDAKNKETSVETQRIVNVENENKAMKKQMQKNNGITVAQDLNALATSTSLYDRDQAIQTAKAKIKSNPGAYEALGIKDANSMGIVNIYDSKHKTELSKFLETQGVNAEAFGYDTTTPEGKEQWMNKLGQYANHIPAIMVDNTFVPLESLGIGIGSATQSTPEQKKAMEDNRLAIQGLADDMVTEEEGMAEQGYISKDMVSDNETIGGQNIVSSQPADAFAFDPDTGYVDNSDEAKQARGEDTNMVGGYEDYLAVVDRHETSASKDRYTQKNPKSSAYGRGQVIDDTNASVAKKLGMTPEQARTQEGQDLVLKELYKEFDTTLETNGLPKTKENFYALHQLGGPVGTKYLMGNIDDSVIKGMRNQFGAKANSDLTDDEIVTKWTNKFGTDENGQVANKLPAQKLVTTVATQQNGEPANEYDMQKVYALLGKKYPYGTDADAHKTAKIRNYKFLIGEGLEPEQAFDATFGAKVGGQGSRKQVGFKQAVAENIAYDAKVANGTPLTVEEEALYNANLIVQEDFDDPAGIQTKKFDKQAMTEGRTKAREALGRLKKKPNDQLALDDLQDSEFAMQQVNSEAYKSDLITINKLKEKQVTVDQTADVLNRVLHGDLQDIERNAIETTKQALATVLPDDIAKDLDPDWKATIQANLKKDASLGLLQAQFIKSISGATVTDKEREVLMKTMLGGTGWNNKNALITALTEFHSFNGSEMTKMGEQLKRSVSPYSGEVFSRFKTLGAENVPKGKEAISTVPRGQRLPTKEEWKAKKGSEDGYDAFVAKYGGA